MHPSVSSLVLRRNMKVSHFFGLQYESHILTNYICFHSSKEKVTYPGLLEFSENSLLFFGFIEILLNFQCAYELSDLFFKMQILIH